MSLENLKSPNITAISRAGDLKADELFYIERHLYANRPQVLNFLTYRDFCWLIESCNPVITQYKDGVIKIECSRN